MMRLAFIYKDESGAWVAQCPSLPGCVSQGASREDALANIREAIDLYVEALTARGRKIPEETFESMVVTV